jgi:hypothetical protein
MEGKTKRLSETRGDSIDLSSLISQTSVCRNWHLLAERLPRLHRVGPSASLDESSSQIVGGVYHGGGIMSNRTAEFVLYSATV